MSVVALLVMTYATAVLYVGARGCKRCLPFEDLEGDMCRPGDCRWCDEIRELEGEELEKLPMYQRRMRKGAYR